MSIQTSRPIACVAAVVGAAARLLSAGEIIFRLIAVAAVTVCAVAQERIDPLPPEQVFIFSADSQGSEAVAIFSMPEDFYLYRKRFQISTDTPGFRVVSVAFPPAEEYDDPFFGITGIYRHGVTLRAQIAGSGEFELKVIAQGCDEQLGICYPPLTHMALLDIDGVVGGGGGDNMPTDLSGGGGGGDNAAVDLSGDEAAAAAALISDSSLWTIMAAFFGFGLLLSFTPCVLPMLPVLLGVVGGGTGGRQQRLVRTVAYIGGVAATYTLLGVAAGLSGKLLAPLLQQPAALLISSAIFVALALSMFGWYDIQMPSFLRNRAGGAVGGAFLMGALSAAVVSPCVAAPLIGALIYIGNTGDALVGGAALLSLSLGMSVLLAVAGIGGSHLLPRAGAWTDDIKQLLGAMLLGAAIWVSSSLLPPPLMLALYGVVLIFCGVILFAAAARIIKTIGIVALLWGAAMIIAAAGGGRDPLSPLSHFAAAGGGNATSELNFVAVHSPQELQQKIAAANRPVMLEFYADWCVSCKEMERFTFTDTRVQERLRSMLLLRADVTADTENARALLKQFGLYGPPAIIFFTAEGAPISRTRVNGYQSADKFLQTLAQAQQNS